MRPTFDLSWRTIKPAFCAAMALACVQASGTTAPPPPRTLEHVVRDATYIFVGEPVKSRYLGFDYRNPDEIGREFAEKAPGRMPVYDVSVKRILFAQDISLPTLVPIAGSDKAGPDSLRIKLGQEYVFIFSRASKGSINSRVIYQIQDPPLDRMREKEVSEVIARIRKERDRK